MGKQIVVLAASSSRDIDAAFTALVQERADGLLIAPQTLFLARRGQIVGLTLRHAVPAIFSWREAVEIGGVMSYASSLPDHYRQVGIYVGRVLKGERPGDLPIIRASKFELVINQSVVSVVSVEKPITMRVSLHPLSVEGVARPSAAWRFVRPLLPLFEVVVPLTAKTIGLDVPAKLLASADKVIE